MTDTDSHSNSNSLSEALKRERMAKKISLEEISKLTNISPRSLQALENGEFGRVPGEFYLKNYIKSYLKAIGCEEDSFFTAYQETLQAAQPEPAKKEKKSDYYSILRYSRFKKKSVFFSGFIFVVLFGVVFFILYIGKNNFFNSSIPLHSPGLSPLPATTADTFDLDYHPVQVRLEFQQNCWLQVHQGQASARKKIAEQVYQKGQHIQFKGYALELVIGNPSAVRLYLNNREVTYLKSSPRSERVIVTPANVKEIVEK